jgi:surfactin synthase thioesterase subunit
VEEARSKDACLDWIETNAGKRADPRKSQCTAPTGPPGAAAVVPFPQLAAMERLFVFPHAGSGVTYYHFLAKALSTSRVEVVLVLYPGRELRMREDPIESMDELVSLLLIELGPCWDGRPFQFLGHSMGALAAFELAHRLRAEGLPEPDRLILSGRQPPHLVTNVLKMDGLSDAAFLDAVGHRYGAIPQAILENEDLCALILRGMRGDFVLMERYLAREREKLDQPLLLVNGREDRWIDPAHVAEWDQHTTGEVSCHFFDGDHFYLPQQTNALVRLILDEAGTT